MRGFSHSLTRALFRLAAWVMPSDRTDWVEAMAAEWLHLPTARRFPFAGGCFAAAVRARIADPRFPVLAVQAVLVSGATFWAAMNVRFAGRMSVLGSDSLELFAYMMSAVFLAGAIVVARSGFRYVFWLGVPLALILAAAATTLFLVVTEPSVRTILVALLVEDLAILLGTFVVVAAASSLTSRGQGAIR